ncbi:MAG: PP2C family protein-serine/threonine phosphatase [Phycisphaerae bacterium]
MSGSTPLTDLSVQLASAASKPFRLLIVGPPEDLPQALAELIERHEADVILAASLQDARHPKVLANVETVILCAQQTPDARQAVDRAAFLLADSLVSHHLMGLAFSSGTYGVVHGCGDVFIRIPTDVSSQELSGWLSALRHVRPHLRRINNQVAAMQRLGRRVNENLLEVDQELRLAGRLQRDFLPKVFPELADVRFAAMYRPATWVSGDIYDVRQLDQRHIGFFLADAMGHGVAAGLMTMFIKEAIVGHRAWDAESPVRCPSKVLTSLNADLTAQQLPNCQFVTACYGHIDIDSHEVALARAGHPHPIHVSPDGQAREVKTAGGLLGIFPEGDFPSTRLTLQPGEKLLIYSDGLENIISGSHDAAEHSTFGPVFLQAIRLPGQECLDLLARHLDNAEGSLQPSDDQS